MVAFVKRQGALDWAIVALNALQTTLLLIALGVLLVKL